jgi:hypothetical protein
MRDREVIDSELRLLAAVRRTVREEGGPIPTTAPMDDLLDERLSHCGGAGEDAAVDADRAPAPRATAKEQLRFRLARWPSAAKIGVAMR